MRRAAKISLPGKSLSSQLPLTSSSMLPSLHLQRRHRSFNFYLNLEDPEETRRHVEEDLARIDQECQRGTMAHLHALLNLALSYYQRKEYVTALSYAEYTHEKTREHNKNSTFLFFTAKTCARCSLAVADEYEAHLLEMEKNAAVSSTLMPRPSAVFSAERTVARLREDAARYEGIAQRLTRRPEKAFMRRERSTGWSEDTRAADEEPEELFGERWKERRKRPEHAAIRQHYQQERQKQQQPWSSGSGVPK